jgi:hypothetical protein
MKSPTINGWLSWSFNDIPYSYRKSKEDVYKFHVNSFVDRPVKTYKEELYNNAMAMRDYFSDPFDVLLSGGIDSEVIVRTFKDLGIKHNTYIFKYKNNFNYREVNSAIDICQCLNIPYKIIDIDLQKFFETDAYDIFKASGCIRAGRLPHLKFFDYLDNIPIMGEGECYWWREKGLDYSKKSSWAFPMNESNHNCSIYLHKLGRENICDWYEFTPFFVKSFNNLPIIQDLINDKHLGKQSSWWARLPIHKEIWPDIKDKKKLIGYENDKPSGTYPNFMLEMQKVMEKEIGTGNEYWYTIDELDKLF